MKLLEMKRLKEGFMILFVLVLVLGIMPNIDNRSKVYAVPGEINIADGTVTIHATDYTQNGVTVPYTGDYIIAGSSTTNFVQVGSGTHNITIRDLTVDVSAISGCFAFFIQSGANVNLTLQGENSLKSGYYRAGLSVISGAGLTITAESTGSLSSYGNMAGAGIGGNWGAGTSGTIIINGGTVNAIGDGGAGIGGGKGGSNGTVIINGGTVNAVGGYNGAAGIGGGGPDVGENIGGGGGNITISGGTVTAAGGTYMNPAISIGPGHWGAVGTIVFSGGSIKASYISGTPVNASNQPVYKTTLTLLGREFNTLTSGLVIKHSDVILGYGNAGISADAAGKIYLYLPQSSVDTNMNFQANGAEYAYVLPAAQSGSNNAVAIRTAPFADSIAITNPANKLIFKVGESLDVTGMVVTGSYNGYQQTIPVSAANVTGFNSSTEVDSQTLTVTLEGRTTTYTITVIPALSSLTITTPATKLTYNAGESLDITGLVVTGTYTDGSTQVVPITTANVYWFDSRFAGTRTLKVQVDNTYTTYQITIIAPDMYILGKGSYIFDDDVTPSSTDDTDFGSTDILNGSVTKTFTIRNYGSAPLSLSGTPRVAVVGVNASEFTVTAQPADTIVVNGSTTFNITFDPSNTGLRTADITITNDDSFSNPYNFTIQGTGTAAPEITLEGNSTSITDGDVTPSITDHTDLGSTDLISGMVTRTFTIKNTGSSALALTGTPKVSVEGVNAADFTVTAEPAATLDVAGSTTFQVSFDPGAVGVRTANIRIANDDSDENPFDFTIQGTGTVSPEMDITGNGISIADGDISPILDNHTDFGSSDIRDSVVTRTFTVINTGSAALTLNGTPKVIVDGINAADFTVTAQPTSTVATGDSTTFQVTFDPSAAGLRTASIRVANDDSDESIYAFTIQGTGTAVSEIIVQGNGNSIADGDNEPASSDYTDFGSADITSVTVVRTFILENSGSGPLTLNGTPHVAMTGANAADFTVTTEPTGSVAAEGSTTFKITFNPDAEGLRTATVSIQSDDSDENPFTFAIQGTGTKPEINVKGNGSSIADRDDFPSTSDYTDFGGADILTDTVIRSFTVENIGTGSLALNGSPKVEITGINVGDFSVTAEPSGIIGVSESTTFTVTFDPSGEGLRAATISIANSDTDENPYTFVIQGIGTVIPEINIKGNGTSVVDGDSTPNALDHTDFGSANLTSGSVTRTFTIENSGSGTLTMNGTPVVTVSGAHAGDFTVTAQPSSTVEAGGTTTFEVTFDPNAEGLRSATISIANDDSDENPYSFAIQGTGTVKPEINVIGNGISIVDGDSSPSTSDFTDFGSGDVAVGTLERTFTIKNTGDGELTLSGAPVVTISGDDAADFSVIAMPANQVPAGGSTSIKILFDPSGGGTRNATVHIESDDPNEAAYDFAIKGTGTYPSAALSSSQQYTPAQMTEMTRTGQIIQIEYGPFSASITPGVIPRTNGQTIAIQSNAITDVIAINTFFLSYPQQKGVMRAYQLTITGQKNDQTMPITQLNGEITLGFKLSAEDINGIDPSTFAVYKRGDDGGVTKLGGVYDWQTGTLSVRTSHLCQFFIMGKEGTPTERLAGPNRYATAVAISQKGWRTSDCVILTSGENFPDALAGTILASVKSAPILLTTSEYLNKETQAEITRLHAKQIYILGGTSVISQQIEDKLAKDYEMIRVSGGNRYATAVDLGKLVIQEAGSHTSDTVVLVAGMNYPDALAVASYAGYNRIPILFTDTQTLNDETFNALKEWHTKQVILIGGQQVISLKVEDILKEQMNLTVTRLFGADRYLTSLAVTQYFEQYRQEDAGSGTARFNEASLATGDNFPDALAGAVLAAKQNMPLLLVKKDDMNVETEAYLRAMNLLKRTLFGGEVTIQT